MTHHAAPVGAVHAVTKNLALPAALGVRVGAPTFEFRVPVSDEAWALACAQVGAPMVTLHPGAGHPGKRWPLERWLTLSERLSATGLRVVIVTGPDDRAAVAEAVKAMPSSGDRGAAHGRRVGGAVAAGRRGGGRRHRTAALGGRSGASYRGRLWSVGPGDRRAVQRWASGDQTRVHVRVASGAVVQPALRRGIRLYAGDSG
jgi:hypothetical protein